MLCVARAASSSIASKKPLFCTMVTRFPTVTWPHVSAANERKTDARSNSAGSTSVMRVRRIRDQTK